MPRRKTPVFTGSAELDAMVERAAPAILGLLADGVPRTKAAIVAALAGRHDAEDVGLALVRLAVTGEVEQTGGKYALGPSASAWGSCAGRARSTRRRCGSGSRGWTRSRAPAACWGAVVRASSSGPARAVLAASSAAPATSAASSATRRS
jgi:hypothetical protein